MTQLKKLEIKNYKVHNYLLARNYEVVYGQSFTKRVVYRSYLGGVARYIEIVNWKEVRYYVSYPFNKNDKEAQELLLKAKASLISTSEVIKKWLD